MDEIRITGEVESIIYQNADNGYTVFALETEDDEVTCVGIVPQIHAGESLEITGHWSIHPLYGRQIQVTSYENPCLPPVPVLRNIYLLDSSKVLARRLPRKL